jgi:hypothetical protein
VAQPAGPAGADCAGDDPATARGDCDPAGAADVAGAAGADDAGAEADDDAAEAEEEAEEAGADGGADDVDPPDEHPATAARTAPAARTPPSLSLDETEPSMTNHPFWRAVGQRVATPSVRLPDSPRTR